jgi:quinol monooxygenase YgiN
LQLIERWADEAAFKTHFRLRESHAMQKRLQELAAESGAMHTCESSEIKF